MPNFRKYDYNQDAMIVVNFEEQLQPNTFEYTLHKLIEEYIDLSAFYAKYKNDGGGRSAYDRGYKNNCVSGLCNLNGNTIPVKNNELV